MAFNGHFSLTADLDAGDAHAAGTRPCHWDACAATAIKNVAADIVGSRSPIAVKFPDLVSLTVARCAFSRIHASLTIALE